MRSVNGAVPNLGVDIAVLPEDSAVSKPILDSYRGKLLAWNPITQKAVWSVDYPGIYNGGTLATAGDLVFQGTADGRVTAYSARDGKLLWQAAANTGVMAGPVTYAVNGTQYVSFMAGWGGTYPLLLGPFARNATKVRPEARVLTYKLGGTATLPPARNDQGAHMKTYGMIIDGRLVTAERTFGIVNPATEEIFAHVSAGDASHVDAAVRAARNAFPKWSAFRRRFYGVSARWSGKYIQGEAELTATVGLDLDRSEDARRGYENFIGTGKNRVLGVKGRLRRDELDRVVSLDPYLQGELSRDNLNLIAGVRHSRVAIGVEDYYAANGNDGGSLVYSSTTPTVGLAYRIEPNWNVYASLARSIETPTLNELFYSGTGNGFNYGLLSTKALHREVGSKAFLDRDTRLNIALFEVSTENELVVDTSTGGRTSYRNAASALREGIEIGLDTRRYNGWSVRAAVSLMRATYERGLAYSKSSNIVASGRIPGVPNANIYLEVAWKDTDSGYMSAVEIVGRGRIYVEDTNTEKPAAGYAAVNFRFGREQRVGEWRISQFVRFDNLFDRRYVGSVIVGEAAKRYYEAAPGINWLAGFSAQKRF